MRDKIFISAITISKAVNFITDNLDFFSAPFLDHDAFRQWALESGQEQNIQNLSDSLYIPLTNPVSYFAQYIDALIGKSLGPKDTSCLRYGDDKRLIAVLQENDAIGRAIISVANNAAIQKWNDDHCDRVQKTKKINNLFKQLENLQEERKNIIALGYIDDFRLARELEAKIKTEIILLIDDDNEPNSTEVFAKKCQDYILQTRKQITAHWDYKQNLWHLLFCINDSVNKGFSNSQSNLFFNERSKLVETMDRIEKTACSL